LRRTPAFRVLATRLEPADRLVRHLCHVLQPVAY
jgi:hypothetical protein